MKNLLLATTAVVAIYGGTAQAADLPLQAAAPAYLPVANWTGPYVGAHLGVGRMNETSRTTGGLDDDPGPCGQYNTSCHASATGVVGGVEAGYDWQDRYFVYGVAADWTWTDLKQTQVRTSGTTAWTHQAKIDWLASFRGRMGLAVDNTMVYVTGGLALGHLKSSSGTTCATCTTSSTSNYGGLNTTKVGWVMGAGVEHRLNRNWSFKAEGLYYDLGRESACGPGTDNTGEHCSEFHHEVLVGRVGVNYRF